MSEPIRCCQEFEESMKLRAIEIIGSETGLIFSILGEESFGVRQNIKIKFCPFCGKELNANIPY